MKETSNSGQAPHPIFGIRPVIEAIEAGQELDKIYVQKGLHGDLFKQLTHLCRKNNISVKNVPIERLNRFQNRNHQGVVALIAPITFNLIEELLPEILEKNPTPTLLLLDRITDVRNFGAITRTAECAGVDAIIITDRGSAQVGADAVKTSTGAIMRIPICREVNLKGTVKYLKSNGIQIVACTEKTEDTFYTPDYTKPTAIIMGSEENGISDPLLKRADCLAAIPLNGEIGSLNVSVATGIILYEALRQRRS